MGFANGLMAGARAGAMWLDAYDDGVKARRESEALAEQKRIMEAEPETVTDFAPDHDAHVYDGGLRGVTPALDTSGAAGLTGRQTMLPAGTRTQFLGQTVDGPMSQQAVDSARLGALARSMMKRDPARGLAFMDKADEYSQRVGERAKAEAREARSRAFARQLSGMSGQDMFDLAAPIINPDPATQTILSYDNGVFRYASTLPGLPGGEISKAELANLLMQAHEAGDGDLGAGFMGLIKGLEGVDQRRMTALKGMAQLEKEQAATRREYLAGENYINQMDNRDVSTASSAALNRARERELADRSDQRWAQLEEQSAYNTGRLQVQNRAVDVREARALNGGKRAADKAETVKLTEEEKFAIALAKKQATEGDPMTGEFISADEAAARIAKVERGARHRTRLDAAAQALSRDIAAGAITPAAAAEEMRRRGWAEKDVVHVLGQAGFMQQGD